MKTLVDKLKSGVKKAIVLGSTLALFALPKFANGQDLKVFSQKHVTDINPQGIVTGGVDLNDPKYGKRITEEEIDAAYRLKGTTDDWYGSQVVNPFITPGVRGAGTKDYYGSGDADGDGDVDWEDVKYIVIDNKKNYRCDVNGNGVEGDQTGRDGDDQIIGKFIDGQMHYMPGQWNYLNTENSEDHDEKIEWFEKMVKIDDTNTYVEGFGCGDYASKFVFRSAGLEKAREFPSIAYFTDILKLNLDEDNGLYNLPVYMVFTKAKDGQDHFTVGTLTGKNPLKLENYKVLEEQIDEFVQPGDFSMRNEPGDIVRFERLCYNEYPGVGPNYGVMPSVTFQFDSAGKPQLKWKHPDLVTERPGNPVSGIENNSFDKEDIIGNVYPNPFMIGHGDLKIPYYGNGLEANVSITDILGRVVYNEKYESNAAGNEIKVSGDNFRNKAAGYYNVVVSNKNGREVSRIVVQK